MLVLARETDRAQAGRESLSQLVGQITALLEEIARARTRSATLIEEARRLRHAAELRRRPPRERPHRPRRFESDNADVDALHRRYAESRDPRLRAQLVEVHAPLAYGLTSRFLHRGESPDDLQQVALLALVKAVDRFEPGRGLQFSTFATPTVLGELKRHFRDRAWAIRLPRRLHDRYLSVQRARDDLAQELGRSPTIEELAERVGTTVEEVIETMEASDVRTVRSLDTPMPGSDDGELASFLGGPDEQLVSVEQRETIAQLLGRLNERERDVLELRFYDGLTQLQIAERLGTNQMHVSRLLHRSLERLRALATAG